MLEWERLRKPKQIRMPTSVDLFKDTTQLIGKVVLGSDSAQKSHAASTRAKKKDRAARKEAGADQQRVIKREQNVGLLVLLVFFALVLAGLVTTLRAGAAAPPQHALRSKKPRAKPRA